MDGKPVAFMIFLPNLNESFKRMGGRLLPGLFRLIGDLRYHRIRSGRIPLMGVRQKFQNTPLGMALAFMVINELREPVLNRGIREVEMSWILEDNKGMRSILDVIGSRNYKTYRVYEKILEP